MFLLARLAPGLPSLGYNQSAVVVAVLPRASESGAV